MEELGAAIRRDLVNTTRGAVAFLFDGYFLNQAFFGQFVEGKINGAEGDGCPIIHMLFDNLFNFVAV